MTDMMMMKIKTPRRIYFFVVLRILLLLLIENVTHRFVKQKYIFNSNLICRGVGKATGYGLDDRGVGVP
jgi:hypothetical protein